MTKYLPLRILSVQKAPVHGFTTKEVAALDGWRYISLAINFRNLEVYDHFWKSTRNAIKIRRPIFIMHTKLLNHVVAASVND